MPLGTEVGLGPGDIVLDEDPAHPRGGSAAPTFRPTFNWAKWSPSQQQLSYDWLLAVHVYYLGNIFYIPVQQIVRRQNSQESSLSIYAVFDKVSHNILRKRVL